MGSDCAERSLPALPWGSARDAGQAPSSTAPRAEGIGESVRAAAAGGWWSDGSPPCSALSWPSFSVWFSPSLADRVELFLMGRNKGEINLCDFE